MYKQEEKKSYILYTTNSKSEDTNLVHKIMFSSFLAKTPLRFNHVKKKSCVYICIVS